MSETTISGAEFKKQLRDGVPKLGLFVNSHSATLTEQLAHSGYDWLLIDTQHGPMGNENLSAMLNAVCSGGAKSMVRVAGYHDRGGIQQALGPWSRWCIGSLYQYCGGSTAGGELCTLSHGRHALGLLSATQHQQSGLAGLRRQCQQEHHRCIAG